MTGFAIAISRTCGRSPSGGFPLAVCFLLIAFAWTAEGAPWLARNAFNRVAVVVGSDASPSEQFAAEEFSKYWEVSTGAATVAPETPGATRVWIGRSSLPSQIREGMELDGLGDDGFVLRTVDWDGGRHLAIVGGERRGTLYGVYEFFERYLGLRWLTPDDTYVPDAPPRDLPRVNYRYVPPVFYRDISQRTFMTDPEFAVKHHMNGRFVNSLRIGGSGTVPAKLGGKIDYVNGFAGWGHTFFTFVSPDEYFDAHPEYFSETDGERQKNPTQLCLTNTDVLRIVTEKAKARLREEPDARVVSISQMDWEYYCTCPACRAINEREGTPAGTLVDFVNAVADGIATEFPEAHIDTFAYMYTQTPPKTLRVRDNVIVRLCTFNNDFSKVVTNRRSARNRRFVKDLEGWTRIAKNVFIYDYLPNFHCFQQPNPNLRVIQPNYAYFVKKGVTGLYAQGNPESPNSEFEHLRAYVAAKAMWDPEIDAESVINEFIDLYYGEAASYIRQYIDLVTQRAKESGAELTLFASLDWMDYDTVVRADELFRLAFMHVHDPKYRKRLREAYLPVRYAALVCRPRVTWHGDRVVLERPDSLSFDQYWNLLQYHGVTHMNDYPIETLRAEMMGRTPPRRIETTVHVLKNTYWKVSIAPELSGALVRMGDRRHHADWLTAYEDLGSGHGALSDVVMQGDTLLMGDSSSPIAFEPVEVSDHGLTMQAGLENVVVIRDVSLVNDTVTITTTFRSESDAPLSLRVKTHPEFHMQQDRQPALWTREGSEWAVIDDYQTFSDGDVRVGVWDMSNGSSGTENGGISWATGDGRGPVIESRYEGPFSHVYFQTSLPRRRIVLDAIANDVPIPPRGETTLTATYRAVAEMDPIGRSESHE